MENKDLHKILEQINQFDDEYYIERDYPVCYPKIDIIIRSDGQTLKFDRSALTFFLAPGHNPDGIFTLVQPGNVWIAGDYLSDVEFPYIYYSSKLYENTLKKGVDIMEKFSPSLLVPGHGNATADIDEMKKRIEESESYIRLLKKCVQNEVPFPFDQLMLKYRFPGIMKRFHEENVALIRKELRKT